MIEKKSDIKKIKVGDPWSRLSNGKVTKITKGSLYVENEAGKEWEIGFPIVEDEFYFADQFDTELKVTRTELSQIFINHPRIIMTACYHKQVKEKDLNEEFFKLYANEGGVIISKVDYTKKVKELTKVALKGEERVIVGRHESSIDDFGRMHFTDVEIEQDKTKEYDVRHRLVDPRTLKFVIVANVKYTAK